MVSGLAWIGVTCNWGVGQPMFTMPIFNILINQAVTTISIRKWHYKCAPKRDMGPVRRWCRESLPGRIDAQCVKKGALERFGEEEAMGRVDVGARPELGCLIDPSDIPKAQGPTAFGTARDWTLLNAPYPAQSGVSAALRQPSGITRIPE